MLDHSIAKFEHFFLHFCLLFLFHKFSGSEPFSLLSIQLLSFLSHLGLSFLLCIFVLSQLLLSPLFKLFFHFFKFVFALVNYAFLTFFDFFSLLFPLFLFVSKLFLFNLEFLNLSLVVLALLSEPTFVRFLLSFKFLQFLFSFLLNFNT